jgi:hypothetical protein
MSNLRELNDVNDYVWDRRTGSMAPSTWKQEQKCCQYDIEKVVAHLAHLVAVGELEILPCASVSCARNSEENLPGITNQKSRNVTVVTSVTDLGRTAPATEETF